MSSRITTPRVIPTATQVAWQVLNLLAPRAMAERSGPLFLTTFNGYYLSGDKARLHIDSQKALLTRSHVVFYQETTSDAMRLLAESTGYEFDVSQRTVRQQAVGMLYHPRLVPIGPTVYHDYLKDLPGHPELGSTMRPAVQRRLADRTTGFVFDAINLHLKSNVGGPAKTAPMRRMQIEMLVQELDRRKVTGPLIIVGDFNAAVNESGIIEIEPLLQAGFTLVRASNGLQTYPGGQFDAFFIRGFPEGMLGDGNLWIPEFPADKQDRATLKEFSDHLPSILSVHFAADGSTAPAPSGSQSPSISVSTAPPSATGAPAPAPAPPPVPVDSNSSVWLPEGTTPAAPANPPAAPRKAVFFSRSTLLARMADIPADVAVVAGASEAIASLKAAGYAIIAVNNEGGLHEGVDGKPVWNKAPLNREKLGALYGEINRQLGVAAHFDEVRFCPHAIKVNCSCRKPSPKMLQEAAQSSVLSLGTDSFLIGLTGQDLAAGTAAGVTSLLLQLNIDGKPRVECPAGITAVESLTKAAEHILQPKKGSPEDHGN